VARLFVAVVPPDEVLDRVAALRRPDVSGLRWTTRDQWHVTLRFLGQVDDADAATRVLEQMALSRCEARLGPEVGRFGRQILHVPVAGLGELAAAVVGATAAIGEPPEDRAFNGHVTLARTGSRRSVDLRALTGEPVDGVWSVDEVELVESHLHRRGARYETIARVRAM
jgi:2'-5' RNA ligase